MTCGRNDTTVRKPPMKPRYASICYQVVKVWLRLRQPIVVSWRSCSLSGGWLDRETRSIPNGEPVRSHPIPLLNQQALLLEHKPDLARIVAADLLENRNQNAQRVVADHGAPRDLRNVPCLRCSDRQAFAAVD